MFWRPTVDLPLPTSIDLFLAIQRARIFDSIGFRARSALLGMYPERVIGTGVLFHALTERISPHPAGAAFVRRRDLTC